MRVFRYVLYIPVIALPVLAYCFTKTKKRELIDMDAQEAYSVCFPGSNSNSIGKIYRLLTDIKEFRNIFFMRLGKGIFCSICKLIIPELKTFEISTDCIKGGFFVEHATSTYINANAIGEKFSAKQNVTVGWNNGKPTIGNNVRIGTGAVVLGGISIGDNVNIGAGAIVVEDVPDNVTVCGPKAKIVRYHDGPTANAMLCWENLGGGVKY